jgi:hypothetical protein
MGFTASMGSRNKSHAKSVEREESPTPFDNSLHSGVSIEILWGVTHPGYYLER